jgi:hypothetical protein
MRTKAVELTVLALLLAGAGLGHGQSGAGGSGGGPPAKKAPAKSKLEELLAQALKDNPDIRVAAAKAAEADAELHRTRLQVVQKVVAAYRAVELAGALEAAAKTDVARMGRLGAAVARQDLDQARTALLRAKTRLAAAEADLDYLLGKAAGSAAKDEAVRKAAAAALSGLGPLGYYPPASALLSRRAEQRGRYELALRGYYSALSGAKDLKGPMVDKIRKALDRRVTLKFTDTPILGALEYLQKQAGIHIQVDRDPRFGGKVTADLTDLPLGAALQLIEDTLPGFRFAVREYGLFFASAERLPPGALLLGEFWKGGVPAGKPRTGSTPRKGAREGEISQVDPKSGLAKLTLGSSDGLVKGQIVHVYRIDRGGSTGKYLGTLRIMDASPTQAVAQPVKKTADPLQPGDRVTQDLPGR